MNLLGKKIAVLVANNFQELELWYPVLRFKEAGADVIIVGADSGVSYTSKLGYPAKSDCAIHEITADEIDAVLIPGGYAPDSMRTNQKMVMLVPST